MHMHATVGAGAFHRFDKLLVSCESFELLPGSLNIVHHMMAPLAVKNGFSS